MTQTKGKWFSFEDKFSSGIFVDGCKGQSPKDTVEKTIASFIAINHQPSKSLYRIMHSTYRAVSSTRPLIIQRYQDNLPHHRLPYKPIHLPLPAQPSQPTTPPTQK